MKKTQIYILFLSYGFIVFIHVYLSLIPKDAIPLKTWYINGAEYNVPANVKVTHPSTLIALTYFYSDESGRYYLTLPMISANAFEVYINGRLTYVEGYVGGYVNVWTKTFQFPIELIEGRNEIRIIYHNLYSLTFRKVPYIAKRSYRRASVLNLLIDLGSEASAGVAIILGIFLAFLSFRRSHKDYYTYFAHAFILLGIYVFDLSFWEFYLSQPGFMILKRIVYFSLGASVPFFMMSADMIKFGRVLRSTRILGYIAIALSYFILLYPDYGIARYVHIRTSPYLIFLAVMFWLKMISYGESMLTASSFLLVLGAIQHAISVFYITISIPTIIGYSVIYLSIIFTYYLVTQQKQIETTLMEVNEELFKDPLTGAYNRRMFNDLEVSQEDALIFFDMDDFKELNDLYGHDYGDEVLKKFAEIAKRVVRRTDYVVRYGGDEFVVLLKGCDERKARNIARKIAKNFHEKTKAHLSFGISTGHVNIYDALKAADQNMYRIKRSKKGS